MEAGEAPVNKEKVSEKFFKSNWNCLPFRIIVILIF